MASNVKIRSLNTNGIHCLKKRNLVFSELSKYQNEILMLQETHSCPMDERHYKNKWGPNVFFSHGLTNSKGVCTIIPKNFPGSTELLYSDLEGRLLAVKLTIGNEVLIIVNIYAPTSNYEVEQVNLLITLNAELFDYKKNNCIFGGDWNVTLNPELDKKSVKNMSCPNLRYRDSLKLLIDEYEMSDCWRLAHPKTKKFTCRSGRHGANVTQSRIDIFFISETLLNNLAGSKIEAGFMSDHNYITINIKLNDLKRGKGTWKFNNSLLHDKTYVDTMKDLIKTEKIENDHYTDKGFLWDYIKMRVRSETMLYTSINNKKKREVLLRLENDLERLDQEYMENPTDDIYAELASVKRELEDCNKEKLEGTIFRSKCEWAEHGEKNSKYFLNLEKYNYTNKCITSLECGGKMVTEEKEVLSEIKKYYEKLYGSNRINRKKLDDVLTDIPKLTESQKVLTKGLVTYEQCLKALKTLANGKTPGMDGITTDFYKFFWLDISDIVLDSINHAFIKQEMSTDQRMGIISLSPKKNKIRRFLKNWRPITLLTVDYKLLAKVLAMRLTTILPDYIEESQFGYIKDRYIGENIRCIIDLNDLCIKEKKLCYGIQIDFEKAFDSINWDFMFISLEKMNFDKDFIQWVRILYKNTMSCVTNNGYKTEPFNLKKGVHQGCPLSALLFIILVQVLQHMLDKNNEIKGIKVETKELKILQMADDTTILTSDLKDIPKILELLETFKEISGLKTNIEKTIAYKLGEGPDPKNQLGLNWSKGEINLLGVAIGESIDDANREKNFKSRIEGMETLTKIWARRNLSMKGKLTIINSLLIPKLIYPCTILDVPDEIVQQASNVIRTFFWNWKRPKIKVDTLVRNIVKGGLKYPCIDCKIKSWRTIWAVRAIRLEDKKPLWTRIVNALLPKGLTITYLLKCKPTVASLEKWAPKLPTFYKRIIENWTTVKGNIKYITKDTIKKECLWLNRDISVKNVPLYCTNSLQHGIYYVSDILNDQNEFLSLIEINQKFGTNLTFLDLLRIRLTLPHKWKEILQGDGEDLKDDEIKYNRFNNLKTLKTKSIYWEILEENHDCVSPSNIHINWTNYFSLNEEQMQKVYTLPYEVTRWTKLQALQYKIVNKIINCNYWLHKIKIKDEPTCRFCDEIETLQHFLFGCKTTKQFWKAMLSWYNGQTQENIEQLTERDITLGYIKEPNQTLNCCILLGKSMIYDKKNHNIQPDIYLFHCEFKEYMEIEKKISKSTNSLDLFNDKWGLLVDT
jgi:hypothetical protein